MGMIINKHYTIVQQDESILKMLIYKLSKASDKKEYVIVDGIICCISDCLIHMPSNSEDTSMNQIYQLLKKLLEVKDTRDKTFQRSNKFVLLNYCSSFLAFFNYRFICINANSYGNIWQMHAWRKEVLA